MTDNITLPREVVEKAVKAFENGCPPTCEKGMVDSGGFHPWSQPALVPCPACLAFEHLRTHLAAEQPSKDDERYREQKERSYRLQRLLKECVKVMQANAVFRDTKAHKDLKTRIRAELEDKT